ncbi:sensor histidine kinase [Lachnospira multipara]|uniref:sensor histidine kinase n=1 Tax=Lachnospira multipara TaxID=28051 RepID=UPI0004E1EAB0|nr:ATP-binding protein [Lachnospira multipara]
MENDKNKRQSSVARKINFRVWLHTLKLVIVMDMGILIASFALFFYQNFKTSGFSVDIKQVCDFYDNYVEIGVIILIAEFIFLVESLFNTKIIRKQLRTLNDLAIQAEVLAKSANQASLDHLEEVLNAADETVTSIKLGDKDLESLEIAINSLIRRLQEAKNSQARFVSDASHELRTPIAVIQGYVNMLDRWGKDDREILEESVNAIKNESDHMKELIEQLLFLARGDSGRNILNRRDFYIEEMLYEIWEESLMVDEEHIYRLDNIDEIEKLIKKTADIEDPKEKFAVLDNKFHKINGDYGMIKQAARIFLQNAAKYSESHSVIRIGVYKEGAGFLIQDEGIGMNNSEISHIFERFYRSDEVRNSTTGGSGLGLSIAKWIVDAHEGKIEVLSRPEFGTRFMVSFK